MASAEQLQAGIGSFLQKRIMPKLDSTRQFLLGTVYGLGAARMEAVMAQAAKIPALQALGVVRENGEIDLDALYNAAYAQMQAQGKVKIELPMLGEFAFDSEDLRELYQEINGQERRN